MSSVQVHILGIRHHSPACARLVQAQIMALRPTFVLIEGPSDYNARLDELLLGHELPIALYSFSPEPVGMAQCWYPLVDYSPEWVALQTATAQQATVRFIDLPHWHYRTLAESARTVGQRDGRARYRKVLTELCQRFYCDSDDALWDHLFEAAPPAELAARLDEYFALLRGDPLENRTQQDDAREQFMARYIAWAAKQVSPQGDTEKQVSPQGDTEKQVSPQGDTEKHVVLVICGGWHKAALEQLWPTLHVVAEPVAAALACAEPVRPVGAQAADSDAPEASTQAAQRPPGSYLVPYQFRQVEALAGYASGMQSPMFYQWVWQLGYQGAVAQAKRTIVLALRAKRVALSSADLIAMEQCLRQLSALRGHVLPMRIDLLDAVQSTLVKDALDAEPPWSASTRLDLAQHPILTEALLAMTGDGCGTLHPDTPQPPLLASVHQQLAALDLLPNDRARELILDRRNALDQRKAIQLWRLSLLGCSSVRLLGISAPNAARALPKSLHFLERWQLARNPHWHTELIVAAAFGADLASASLACLQAKIARDQTCALPSLSAAILEALRAGFTHLSASLAREIAAKLPETHDHIALASAVKSLQEVQTLGYFGSDADAMIVELLAPMLAHLLWLVDGLQSSSTQTMDGDVQAISCLYAQAQRLAQAEPNSHTPQVPADADVLAQALVRLAWRTSAPASLRGAALGAAYQLGALNLPGAMRTQLTQDDIVIQITKAQAPRTQLGDFLFGLFALARSALKLQGSLVRAIHAALESMSTEDFLVALPQLRGAFAWFPPRERAKLAEHAAELLGIQGSQKRSLMQLTGGTQRLLAAKAVEANVDAWALAHGLEL